MIDLCCLSLTVLEVFGCNKSNLVWILLSIRSSAGERPGEMQDCFFNFDSLENYSELLFNTQLLLLVGVIETKLQSLTPKDALDVAMFLILMGLQNLVHLMVRCIRCTTKCGWNAKPSLI